MKKSEIISVLTKYNGRPLIAIGIIILIMIVNGMLKGDAKDVAAEKSDDPSVPIAESSFDSEEDDTLSIFGIKEIEIKEGSTLAEFYYLNPEQNADKYFIQVSIYLKENNELIYRSDLIPPGKGINSARLSRSFEEGKYPAILHVQGYRMQDFSSAKAADLDIVIIAVPDTE